MANIAEKGVDQGYVIIEPRLVLSNVSEYPEEIEKEEASDELSNSVFELRYHLDDDNLPLKCEEDVKSASADAGTAKLKEFNARDYLYIDCDLALDIKNNKCFTYMFNKGKYLHSTKKKVPGLINLMRRQKPKGIILTVLKKYMEKCISLHKLSKLFEKMNKVYKTSQVKGVVAIDQCTSHEVKRVTAVCSLAEQSLYKPGQVKPALYLSRSGEAANVIKVIVHASSHRKNEYRAEKLLSPRKKWSRTFSCRS